MAQSKLLFITHDDALARAYQARLKCLDVECERYPTGQSGLTRARRWLPDLILLDASLPGLHGLDVLKMIRDVPPLAMKHVVLLIERTLARDLLDECLLWGADSYLYKDRCSVDEFAAHVQRLLQTIDTQACNSSSA